MNSLYNYTGRKICESCLNHAITSYVFIHRARYVRNRLNTCVTSILDNLTSIQPVNNIFVEISQNVVCPKLVTFEQDFLLNVGNDETKYPVDVLEDEFREESDSENEIESEPSDVDLKDGNAPTIGSFANSYKDEEDLTDHKNDSIADFPPNTLALTESMNGFREDVCSEFLTFNKKPTVVRRRCTFTCPVCSKRFISSYFFNRHVVRHINKKVQCTKCNDVFSSKFTLYEHTKMVHLLKTNHVSCTTCGRCFTSQHKLRNHEKYHKTKLCELCDKTFQSQAFYDSHMQRHQPKLSLRKKRVQTCSFCEKSCPSDNELSLHVNKAHLQIKPYSCDMCDRHFYTEYNLRCHKRVHSMRSKETCVFCSKKLNSRKQLVIHVRKHIGVKPYCCDVCGLSFYSQHKNGAHMKMSHGGRFCCRICKSVLTTRTALKDHVNVAHGCI